MGQGRDSGLKAELVEHGLNRVAEVSLHRLVRQNGLQLLRKLLGPGADQTVARRVRSRERRAHAAREYSDTVRSQADEVWSVPRNSHWADGPPNCSPNDSPDD